MERKYNVAVTLEERIKKANKLIDNMPDGGIVDADTLLCDVIQNADFEVTGLAQDIFNIWLNSSDRASVEALFYDLTDMQLDEFVDLCLKNMTRRESVESVESSDIQYAVIASYERELRIVGACDTKEEAYELMKDDFLKTVRECQGDDTLRAEDFSADDGFTHLNREYAYANLRGCSDWKIEKIKSC